MIRKLLSILCVTAMALAVASCGAAPVENTSAAASSNTTAVVSSESTSGQTSDSSLTVNTEDLTMLLKISGTEVPVIWEDNESVKALKSLAAKGLTISMSMYGGFEQVGSIGQSITRSDKQTTTSAGDIVLYSGDQMVIFYGSNSWSYTRLGRIDLPEDQIKELLSKEDVTVTLELK